MSPSSCSVAAFAASAGLSAGTFHTRRCRLLSRALTRRRAVCRRAAPRLSPVRAAATPAGAAASWSTAARCAPTLRAALRAAVRAALPLAPAATPPSLLLAFVAGAPDAADTPRLLRDELRRARVDDRQVVVLGCTAESVDREGEEVGDEGGEVRVELVAACLPGVNVLPFRVGQADCAVDLDWRQGDWASLVGCEAGSAAGDEGDPIGDNGDDATTSNAVGPVFLLFGAEEFDMYDLTAGLDFAYPRSPKVGASAGPPLLAADGLIFGADGGVYDDGAVGVALQRVAPGVRFEVVVAQGARAVGPRMTVLAVRDKVEVVRVREETGAGVAVEGPPMQLLDLWTHTGIIDEEDADGARMYLGIDVPTAATAAATPEAARAFVVTENDDKGDDGKGPEGGSAGDETRDELDAPVVDADTAPAVPAAAGGGMLVRRIVGVDGELQTVAVSGPPVRLGCGARFHVRDAASAAAELGRLQAVVPAAPLGGLLLTDRARAEMAPGADRGADRGAFGGSVARLVGAAEVGPLPAPGFQKFFPIREPGSAASTFQHASAAVYLLCYDESLP